MLKQRDLSKLTKMIGRHWMYKTTVYTFQSFEISGREVVIAAAPKWLYVKDEVLAEFMNDCLPVDGPPARRDADPPARIDLQVLNGNATDLVRLMRENIEAVKKDPAYAKQARAVASGRRMNTIFLTITIFLRKNFLELLNE